ncbi:hypothetical protein EXU85_03665 [Spirosoma sp. KCTC 42546]|uniref:hypothetical protein n=1 Tax=Spirosoma sp. KCTC 42546 TaxID=2520506 RepID=UPI00115ABAB8|nr:hypothetical protein [Spirosoma sp. KCTC 42546]QDK77740.1 hypothetical protein EXU85_03665 [Spirosoma sp. KCTC 42546]
MFRITESSNSSVTFLLSPRNYTQIYNRLKTLLSAEQLALFARPEKLGDTMQWSSELPGNSTDIIALSALSEADKDQVADMLEEQKAAISGILSANSEFESILNQLFSVPETSAIKVLRTDQALVPILTQWGCRLNESDTQTDPVTTLINKPRINSAPVVVSFFYTDGSPATAKEFYIEYLNRESKERTSKEGQYNRGRCKLNSQFTIYDLVDGQQAYKHEFTVSPDGTYVVRFPYLTSATIQVVDQKNRPLADVAVDITVDGQSSTHASDKVGLIQLAKVEAGKPISITEQANPNNNQQHQLAREQNRYTLQVYRPIWANASLKVVDQNGIPQVDYSVVYTDGNESREGITGSDGALQLGQFEEGKAIKVWPKNKPDAAQTHAIQEGTNEFILTIHKDPPKFVKVTLLGYDGKPIPGINMGLKHASQSEQVITDEVGTSTLPFEWFTDKKKVKATGNVKSKNKKGKEKIQRFSESFPFKVDQLAYTIRLKRKRPWWLLLLLLLPLLLLLQCEKTIYVKTVDANTKQPVVGAEVNFTHTKSALYENSRFFTNDNKHDRQPSALNGIAKFEKVKYTVYSWLFKHGSIAQFWAVNNCYSSDTLRPAFHSIKDSDTLTLSMRPVMIAMDFKAVDKADKAALPQTKITIISELGGGRYIDTATTGANGRVAFYRVPKCGRVISVRGEHDGYFPDSIVNHNPGNLLGAIDQKRLLQLQPIRKPIEFFVVDCQTRQPIAGATVEVEFDFNGQKSKSLVKTNTDGQGKGVYGSAYVIALIHLKGYADYYKDGELADQHLVGDFIDSNKYPKDKRTFCLEPEPNPLVFQNIDERTNAPLAGVKNSVTIINGSGMARTIIKESNRDGSFTVSINPGDKVSNISELRPDYEDNTTKIQDKDGMELLKGPADGRIIPLKPKEVDLVFRTIEELTGQVLPDAVLNITVDGKSVSPTNSGTGEFTVKAPASSAISIVASKPGYGSNSSKVNNESVKLLQSAPQPERDIPLKIASQPKPCVEPEASQTNSDFEEEYNMGDPNRKFTVNYDMRSIPDRLIITCGRKNESGKILFDQDLQGPGTIPIDMSTCGNSSWITVKVVANKWAMVLGQDTEWSFQFVCENQ